jgi:hypothetical protein
MHLQTDIFGSILQEQGTTVSGRPAPIRTVPVLVDQDVTRFLCFHRGRVTVKIWVTL